MTVSTPLHIQIRSKRRELDMKQAELARLTGIDQALLSRIETGKMCNISVPTLENIFKSLGYTEYKINLPKQ